MAVPPASTAAISTATPATVTTVPRNHVIVGRTRRNPQSSPAAKNGPLAIVTTVATATPVRSTATKNSGVYVATPMPPIVTSGRNGRSTAADGSGSRRRFATTTIHNTTEPMAIRAAPTVNELAASGPSSRAVPLVPNSTAAPSTASTATRPGGGEAWWADTGSV
jgi:hypothetical protein